MLIFVDFSEIYSKISVTYTSMRKFSFCKDGSPTVSPKSNLPTESESSLLHKHACKDSNYVYLTVILYASKLYLNKYCIQFTNKKL